MLDLDRRLLRTAIIKTAGDIDAQPKLDLDARYRHPRPDERKKKNLTPSATVLRD